MLYPYFGNYLLPKILAPHNSFELAALGVGAERPAIRAQIHIHS